MAARSKPERLRIGKEIGEAQLTVAEAAVKYDISFYTARNYLRMYKAMQEMDPEGLRDLIGEERPAEV